MTDIDLTAIEERAEAATDGPWSWNGDDLRGTLSGSAVVQPLILSTAARGGLDPIGPNREFIAHARQDVVVLITEVRRLRAALKRQAEDSRFVLKPDPVEQPKTVGAIRAAIDGMPDDAQVFINISGHGEDYAIDDLYPSEQIPVGAPWPTDKRTVGLEIHLGLFTEDTPEVEATDG